MEKKWTKYFSQKSDEWKEPEGWKRINTKIEHFTNSFLVELIFLKLEQNVKKFWILFCCFFND